MSKQAITLKTNNVRVTFFVEDEELFIQIDKKKTRDLLKMSKGDWGNLMVQVSKQFQEGKEILDSQTAKENDVLTNMP